MTFKFKVGDRVKDEDSNEGVVQRVGHRIGGANWMNYYVWFEDIDTHDYCRSSELTLISCASDCTETEKPMSTTSTTNGFAAKIRHAFKSAEDKVLLEAGIIDEAGATTETGRRVLSDLLFEANKADIVARAKKVLDEDKKKK